MTTGKKSPLEKILYEFKTQVINFLNDIISIAPAEQDLVLLRIVFENRIDTEFVLNAFIEKMTPWKSYILSRNEDFFYNNDNIFGFIPTTKVSHFKRMFRDGTFNEEDKGVIWDYFNVFVSLADQYNKLK